MRQLPRLEPVCSWHPQAPIQLNIHALMLFQVNAIFCTEKRVIAYII
jgi:hypothetical protein